MTKVQDFTEAQHINNTIGIQNYDRCAFRSTIQESNRLKSHLDINNNTSQSITNAASSLMQKSFQRALPSSSAIGVRWRSDTPVSDAHAARKHARIYDRHKSIRRQTSINVSIFLFAVYMRIDLCSGFFLNLDFFIECQ